MSDAGRPDALEGLMADNLAYADTAVDNGKTYVKTTAAAKVAWVKSITDGEATYAATAATAAATETASDAGAAATMDGTLAGDEATFELGLEGADVQLDSTDGGDQETLVHTEDTADAADEVAYGQASATYQDAIWSAYATSVGNALSGVPSGTPEAALDQYYATVALDESSQASSDGTTLVNEETQISGEEVTLGDETEAASVGETNADDLAQQSEMETLLPEEVQAVENADNNLTQAVTDDADAQAAYQTSVADASAKFYQDKAAASQAYDNADEAARGACAEADASDWVAYVEQNISLAQLNAEEERGPGGGHRREGPAVGRRHAGG